METAIPLVDIPLRSLSLLLDRKCPLHARNLQHANAWGQISLSFLEFVTNGLAVYFYPFLDQPHPNTLP
jgi:hypothetical protein